MIVIEDKEYYCCASRGRDPDEQDGEIKTNFAQRLEVNTGGQTYALTSFPKDNYILEVWKKDFSDKQ